MHVSIEVEMLLGGGRTTAGGRNVVSAPRQRPDHSGAVPTGVGLEFLNLPSQPVEAWALKCVFFCASQFPTLLWFFRAMFLCWQSLCAGPVQTQVLLTSAIPESLPVMAA